MRKFIFLLVLLCCKNLLGFSQANTELYIKFEIQSRAEISRLTRIISIDNVMGNTVYAYVNAKKLDTFSALKREYTILPKPSELVTVEMSDTPEKLRDNWNTYPTYDAYVAMMNQFATAHPDLCTIETIGTSNQNRLLLAAKISSNVNVAADKPEFFYTSSIHGDETTGAVLMLRLIDYLLTNYGTNPQVTNLVNNVEIYINPFANPDGTYHGGNSTVNGATRGNANGVDMNRNFPDPQDGPHPDGEAWQKETMAMMAFAQSHHIALSCNFHGGIEVVNYPWDTWAKLHADDAWWQHISRSYVDTVHANSVAGYMTALQNGITNGYAWYEVAGGRQDYMNYFANGRELTIELSDTKLLPPAQLPAHWNYNYKSLLHYMEECLYGVRGIVTNPSGQPINAMVTVLNHDMDSTMVFTDPAIGDYHRMLAAGTYTLQFSAYGYISQTIPNVTVVHEQATTLNVTLQQAQTVAISGTITDAATGLPIEGAKIQLLGTPLPAATTDITGHYDISNVLENTYSVRVSKSGYAGVNQSINVNQGNTVFNFQLMVSTAISFENGILPTGWTTSGNKNWTVVSTAAYDGQYSVKSGAISGNQSTTLQVTVNCTAASDVSFYKKVSSESGYDKLYFYIDGVEKSSWSGEVDWSMESFPVTVGSHIFKWTYKKDGSTNSGSDCAWLDYVTFPPTQQPNHAPTFTTTPISSILEGETYTYNITATDADGNPLTISAVKPDWLIFTPNTNGTATLSGVAPHTAIGANPVVISVTDGIVATPVQQSFSIEVIEKNIVPVVVSTPVTLVLIDSTYKYQVTASDANNDSIRFALKNTPAWLSLSQFTKNSVLISGRPTLANLGMNQVTIMAFDGKDSTAQSFSIEVKQPNYAPQFTTTPVESAIAGSVYTYQIAASDANNDSVKFSATTLPTWLSLTDLKNNTATLTGTPTSADFGDNLVVISITDGTLTVTQSFTVNVKFAVGINDVSYNSLNMNLHPNPATTSTTIDYYLPENSRINLTMCDVLGNTVAELCNNNAQNAGAHHYTVDCSKLASGVYLCKLSIGNRTMLKKLIIK